MARDDVADAVVAVLLGEGGYDGRTYDVTGPETITFYEVAEELSRVTGRDITYHAETLDEAYESRASYAAIAAGEMDLVSDAVARLAGHEPQNLTEFLRRYPESYQHLVTA